MSSTSTASIAVPLPGVGGVDISKLLKSQGPVVTAVLLKAGGDAAVEQVHVDTTPQKQMVQTLLGSPFTFLGQYEDEGIMLMCRRQQQEVEDGDDDDDSSLPAWNQHKLQPPLDASSVRGDILLLRVASEENEDDGMDTLAAKSNDEFFLNYTKDEYAKFAARTDIKAPKAVVSKDMEEEEEEEDSDEEDDVEEGFSLKFRHSALVKAIRQATAITISARRPIA
jgi:hypothetical protein